MKSRAVGIASSALTASALLAAGGNYNTIERNSPCYQNKLKKKKKSDRKTSNMSKRRNRK